MPYVSRTDGSISGVYALEQPDIAEEWLDSDEPEVVAFLNPPVALPSLTARQLRLGLVLNGFALDQVEATIDAIENEQDRAVAQIEWEYASQFERDHPLLQQVGAALGLDEGQINKMWTQAKLF